MVFYLKLLDFADLLFNFFGAKLATLFSRQNVTIPKTKKNKFVRIICPMSLQKFGSIETTTTAFFVSFVPSVIWSYVVDSITIMSFDRYLCCLETEIQIVLTNMCKFQINY